jgi:hypothetical protein
VTTAPLRRGLLSALLAILVTLAGLVAATPVAQARSQAGPVDDYASYQPQTRCRDAVRPGTRVLARWINRRYDGGTAAATLRQCTPGTTEHKDGRAIDWTMDATRADDRAEVDRFLERLFRTDARGNADARARRMGIMYVIWDDKMYASYREFEATEYRSSSCASLRDCSPTLRHRDHVHISLSKPGARGDTTWYAGRI